MTWALTWARGALANRPRPQVGESYIYLGNQWNSGLHARPPGPRNHDLLYWGKLRFETAPDGGADRVAQFVWRDEIDVQPFA